MTAFFSEILGARRKAFSAVVLFCPSVLAASEVCMPASVLEAALIDWYDERPTEDFSGTVTLWQAQGRNTWTLVKYHADGSACTIDHGRDWTGFQAIEQLVSDIAQ